MSNLKRWVQRGGGDFVKWTEPGQLIEGVWRGTRDGKYGALGVMDTEAGEKVFPLHTALLLLVDGLKDGTEVRIEYTGKVLSPKSGHEFKAFNLFVAEVEGMPVVDDDVPF